MAFDFLVPVDDKVLARTQLLPPQSLGRQVHAHTKRDGLPVLAVASIAILGVNEARGAADRESGPLDLSAIRWQLYSLMFGNWNAAIADLGDIGQGETVADTYFVVKEVVAGLLDEQIVPIVIGPAQDITYPMYRAFDGIVDMVNMVAVDSRFDFGLEEDLVSSDSYMSKIVSDKPNNLYNFSNIGYQSYYTAQEEVDLMERLFFDAHRLGDITADIGLAEPILRNAHLVSLDARSVRAGEMGSGKRFSPNGFTGREICAIARYAGISENLRAFGLFEMGNAQQSDQLMAQAIWYFVEGFNLRVSESPQAKAEDFAKYIVPTGNEDLIFHKSLLTLRWWVEVPPAIGAKDLTPVPALLPCTEKDYLDACAQRIPERWLKAHKKGFN